MFQVKKLMQPEELDARISEIQAFLEANFDADNPSSCVQRAEETLVYLSITGKMLADAKYHYNQLVGSAILAALKEQASDRMTASTLNNYVKSLARDYQYLCDRVERLNASCTHSIDLLRTLISKHKEEMRQWGQK